VRDDLQVEPEELARASESARHGSGIASDVETSSAMDAVGSAMPGASAITSAAVAGRAFDKSAEQLALGLEQYADALARSGEEYIAVDEQVKASFSDLIQRVAG